MTSQANSKPKILVVDDEPDNLDLLYRSFYREYQVLRANSGPAALELLAQEGDVSVIISDQRMPMMSGTEFLSLTATQYPDIIRIILTGYTDVEDLVEAINSGKVFKYVTKPWEAEELKAVVRQALDTHNVLKARTRELTRTLRRESLLNTVTNTIRSALDYRQILQTIVDTVGHMLEVDVCLLRPFQDQQLADEGFTYQKSAQPPVQDHGESDSYLPPNQPDGKLPDEGLDSIIPLPLLVQTVWETGEVQVIYDVVNDERIQGNAERAEAFRTANIRSSLVVPLICQQEVRAVLALHQCSQVRSWGDDEVQLVSIVADQAALALSQAYAYEEVEALAKREALINTITREIRSSLDPQDIFSAITQRLGQALQVDGCVLSLWTEEDEFVQCVGLYDSSQHLDNHPNNSKHRSLTPQLPISQAPIRKNPILQEILNTQEPVVITDITHSSSDVQAFDLPLKMRPRSLMVVPLLIEGKCIGSITLREGNKVRKWLTSEIELSKSVAAQAAIAVQQSRLYQKTREQAERLIELDRQKTEFFQNISHEFRTPITLIQGPLESVVENGEGLSHAQSAIALRNSRRLLRLVNQLLDLQRLDAGRMQPSFRPCNMVEFITQIVESFRLYCEKKGLQVLTDLLECPTVYLDMEKFDKVVYNLLSNAMKFTPDGGIITVRLYNEGDNCILQIQDTGIGILPEQIPHLFERFRQAEGSENRTYEGSGLGLSLVKELVELHGGQVTVQSVYGQGTQFSLRLLTGSDHLPAEQVLEAPSELNNNRASIELADLEQVESVRDNPELITKNLSPRLETLDSNKQVQNNDQSILVVDDNRDMRFYVADILSHSGYQVLTARNGYEGFSSAQENRPNLIITDLMMPLVTGLEMIQMIRSQDQMRGTPIVLLTAKVNEETRIESTEYGADAYLAKPFNDRELLAAVRNLLALKENEKRVLELNTYLTESVLKRFLPSALVKKAAAGTLSLDLRPEPRLVTVLFSDIVGFTQLSNTLRSRKVAEVLNEYLEIMTKVVFNNGGTVDKFMGDAILALYGAPEELTPNEQVRRAINTARGMQKALIQLNHRWLEQGIFETDGRNGVQFRCGIHQGTAVVGMFGSAERADYTAIGPSVNIAARLQAAAVPGNILVSAAVADYLQEEEITKGSPLELKGIDETVLTFVVTPEL
ncbi:response regulator [Anabaena cylindrica FACHB-243]|uniref:histidine kinase n=1 Tax=Anabaena cylindrica (strain ATCC 27899 / PCC 7122) TaxID=272123 RepID=K9ZPW1_ANACC|nr:MULTISPECIES: response regulator [Anabaena]AFZ60834.1 adenylate/guanylate cyclase with GAF sensor(s) [Anabaena cylindrica PCC 7122]MBD2417132.1 response regulator [Anabaena cylindrica FACHB-243]MBY5280828.1 response regulator [Anabaena sp. CCAP 1446/1C]MBY5307104.1 response regulator [Anabaena sp. CCAP 1446/1C]MCM2406833.1 response regulator [Anabaena sp. CCAP 1446/1C]